MPTNAEVAATFREIADLLDVLGERFKPEAYRRAARSIESLTEDLGAVAARDELRTIPGVGEAIAEKTLELLRTGRIAYFERLKQQVPAGLLDLLSLPGLGPKTARRFWQELGIEGPAELASAIDAGKLDGVAGFGPKKIAQLRSALAAAAGRPPSGRMPIELAYPIAQRLVAGVRRAPGVIQAEIAGSFRRCRETVGDLDVLVTSTAPEQVFDAFSALPEVREVRLRGPTKETVLLRNDLQVDLRVVEPEEFGAALVYFTGSKDHNVHLRTIARDRGLKINEYGVFRGDARVGGRTEADVYGTLKLAWIPPEIREDRGEIDAAATGPLPPLVEADDLTAELHLHLPKDAGPRDADALLAAARRAHLAEIRVVVAGVDEAGRSFAVPESTLARLDAGSGRGLRVTRAIEIGLPGPSAASGGAPGPATILRPTRAAPSPPATLPRDLAPDLVAHVGGESAAREWVPWAAAHAAAIEVGPGPERLDSTAARAALEAGGALAVPTALGRPPDDPTAPIALGFARRAGAGAKDVRNAGSRVSRTGPVARRG